MSFSKIISFHHAIVLYSRIFVVMFLAHLLLVSLCAFWSVSQVFNAAATLWIGLQQLALLRFVLPTHACVLASLAHLPCELYCVWVYCRRYSGWRVRYQRKQLCNHPKSVLLHQYYQLIQCAARLRKLLQVCVNAIAICHHHTFFVYTPALMVFISIGCSMLRG